MIDSGLISATHPRVQRGILVEVVPCEGGDDDRDRDPGEDHCIATISSGFGWIEMVRVLRVDLVDVGSNAAANYSNRHTEVEEGQPEQGKDEDDPKDRDAALLSEGRGTILDGFAAMRSARWGCGSCGFAASSSI